MQLLPNEHDAYQKVLKVVRFFCKPPVDCESLTQEILLEHWSSQKMISRVAIKHRCYDALRSLKTQRLHEEAYSKSDRSQPVPFDYAELNVLLSETQLTSQERTVILLYYAHGLRLNEIARSLALTTRQTSDAQWSGLEKLKETARVIYG